MPAKVRGLVEEWAELHKQELLDMWETKDFQKFNPWYKAAIMIVTVQAARYLDGYRLWLKFNTGESGEVDLQDMIFKYNVAAPLRDMEYFKAFKLDDWPTLAWDCGFDISPETLYERATGKVIEWLQTSQPDYLPSSNEL